MHVGLSFDGAAFVLGGEHQLLGEFLGHGVLAIQGKQSWIGWIQQFTGVDTGLAVKFLLIIGLVDVTIALIVLIRSIRPIILWAAIWGFWTALIRPLVGESIWDFVERSANWGAPLALYYLVGRRNKN